MTHPRTRTGRSLVGMALVLLGLSTYGCGDTGTGTEPAELGDLSASAGLLEPKFNPATTAYTVKLFGNEASTTITVRPQVPGDRVQINNQQRTSQTVTLAAIGTNEVLNIVVTDTGAGGTSKAYAVEVRREPEDTRLRALISSAGVIAPSPFDNTELEQSINNIGNSVTTITLTATKSDPNTVMVIDIPTNSVTVPAGTPSGDATVQLGGPGSDTKVPIIITGPKGGKTTYQVTIKRGASDNAFLGSLSISPGKLDFKSSNTLYEVSVPSGTDKVTVTGKPQDVTASMAILVKDTEVPQPINLLGPGQTTSITVRVTAQDGKSQQNYVIEVKRAALGGNNDLKSLSISPGKLDFKVNQPTYDVNVGSGVQTVEVTATPQDSNASMTINGQPAKPGEKRTITLKDPGVIPSQTDIDIIVTAENKTAKNPYKIRVFRAALNGNTNLKSLTLSPGSLSFDLAELDYNVSLLSGVTSVRITAAPEDSGASVTINGKPSPTDIDLGAQGPEVRITVPVVVTAQNTRDKETYNIFFIRAALGGNNSLKNLTITSHTLSPTFDQTRTNPNYELEVNHSVDSITVNATPQDTGASVRFVVSGSPSSNSISLPPGPSTTDIEIFVKAPNGTEKPYFIKVTRKAPSGNNNLSALSVAAGSVNHPVNLSTPPYTVTVAADTVTVTVTATLEDTNATMEINGQGTSSGVASAPITLVGSETNIPIVVVAVNGDRKDYALTVKKVAPTAPEKPTVSPDLIEADDFCTPDLPDHPDKCFDPLPPATNSREDNVTKVKKPGFNVRRSNSGETAKLYMNEIEVPSSVTVVDDNTVILRPNNDLPDGIYDVTYTLSNLGGESEKSPKMDPQLKIDSTIEG